MHDYFITLCVSSEMNREEISDYFMDVEIEGIRINGEDAITEISNEKNSELPNFTKGMEEHISKLKW